MREWLRTWWPTLKLVLGVVILLFIGRRFWLDLQNPELWQRSLHVGWLVLSGVLYILGLAWSGLYWYRLLHVFEQRPTAASMIRAYYLGHLGKYVPGKAVALLMRATLAGGPGVRVGIAGLTAFYEVLTSMTSGALLAVVLLACFTPDQAAALEWATFWKLLHLETPDHPILDRKLLVLVALVLLVPLVLPILPGFFNRVVGKVADRFRDRDAPPLVRLPTSALVEGLVLTAGCWLLWGLSLWAALQALSPQPLVWDTALWLRWTGLLAIAYVAGFVILLVPGGLGVREFFLTLFLVPEFAALLPQENDPRALVVLTVLVLRLVWTAAELIVAAVVYWIPASAAAVADNRQLTTNN